MIDNSIQCRAAVRCSGWPALAPMRVVANGGGGTEEATKRSED